MKRKFEVELDLPEEIWAEYDVECRRVESGEEYWNFAHNKVVPWPCGGQSFNFHAVLTTKYKVPEIVPLNGWITRDGEKIELWEFEPELTTGIGWQGIRKAVFRAGAVNIDPPPRTDIPYQQTIDYSGGNQ